ncbi:hypothetical protein MARINOS108_90121 [Marinoscillum sp. 108]|nr:hypothetical protein MARINOS108_90121 [Marinoscillum sp. 108]
MRISQLRSFYVLDLIAMNIQLLWSQYLNGRTEGILLNIRLTKNHERHQRCQMSIATFHIKEAAP